MASPQIKDAPAQIPDGYAVIPVSVEQKVSPLRIGVIVKKQADPVAGHLVMLRDLLDAQVYLGAVSDASGRVEPWGGTLAPGTSGQVGVPRGGQAKFSQEGFAGWWGRAF